MEPCIVEATLGLVCRGGGSEAILGRTGSDRAPRFAGLLGVDAGVAASAV
jgi:hypothetical protein